MNVLELFSGIGGMHMALEASCVEGNVVASIDINQWANKVYEHNFPDTKLLNRNIEGLSVDFVNSLDVNVILMSPPCQPFTRNGLQNDINDPRTNPFLQILDILPKLTKVDRILVENVKGFEKSQMRDILVNKLKENNFIYQEFILSPTQVGVPNTRHRYYCLARKNPQKFSFPSGDLMETLPNCDPEDLFPISNILEENLDLSSFNIPIKQLLKRWRILDISYIDSNRSCCFTKAYGRYLEGTGSIFAPKTKQECSCIFEQIEQTQNEETKLKLLKSIGLRFFTPKEISRLMSFPEKFSFPNEITNKQRYMLLGNSINVKVVGELIKLLK